MRKARWEDMTYSKGPQARCNGPTKYRDDAETTLLIPEISASSLMRTDLHGRKLFMNSRELGFTVCRPESLAKKGPLN